MPLRALFIPFLSFLPLFSSIFILSHQPSFPNPSAPKPSTPPPFASPSPTLLLPIPPPLPNLPLPRHQAPEAPPLQICPHRPRSRPPPSFRSCFCNSHPTLFRTVDTSSCSNQTPKTPFPHHHLLLLLQKALLFLPRSARHLPQQLPLRPQMMTMAPSSRMVQHPQQLAHLPLPSLALRLLRHLPHHQLR